MYLSTQNSRPLVNFHAYAISVDELPRQFPATNIVLIMWWLTLFIQVIVFLTVLHLWYIVHCMYTSSYSSIMLVFTMAVQILRMSKQAPLCSTIFRVHVGCHGIHCCDVHHRMPLIFVVLKNYRKD